MCIAIVSTAHPDYPFILLNNRDEFLNRPTAPAAWWPPPDSHILGGRDLFRIEHGTWLGLTQQGRLACLTNFRETAATDAAAAGSGATPAPAPVVQGSRSRGAMVNAYLRLPERRKGVSSAAVARELVDEGFAGVGGFSLLFGLLRRPSWRRHGTDAAASDDSPSESAWDGLAIVSNRSASVDDIKWLCTGPGETHALSNTHYEDGSWPKVMEGERLVKAALVESVAALDTKEGLLERLLQILSRNSLPPMKADELWITYVQQLRNSILIPVIDTGSDQGKTSDIDSAVPTSRPSAAPALDQSKVTSGSYATQKQTVIMVDWSGSVTYLERTLYDNQARPVPIDSRDKLYTFAIDDW